MEIMTPRQLCEAYLRAERAHIAAQYCDNFQQRAAEEREARSYQDAVIAELERRIKAVADPVNLSD